MISTADPPVQSPVTLHLRLPGDPRFSDIVATASRILTARLADGSKLGHRLATTLVDTVGRLLDRDGDVLDIEFRLGRDSIEVELVSGALRESLVWPLSGR